MKSFVFKYLLYLGRWQFSTPILAIFVGLFSEYPPVVGSVVANFVGGLIFFWIDKLIFTGSAYPEVWQVREKVKCADCGKLSRGYRLVFWKGYDRRKDTHPEYRCEECSIKKEQLIKGRVEERKTR